jgi:hypothetical protein
VGNERLSAGKRDRRSERHSGMLKQTIKKFTGIKQEQIHGFQSEPVMMLFVLNRRYPKSARQVIDGH